MKALSIARPGEKLTALCFGAHSDDIEIGAGGTIMSWIASGIILHVVWCVASAKGERSREAEASAAAFLAGAASSKIELAAFKDSYFPYQGEEIKDWMRGIKERTRADIVITHNSYDAHQDHREIANLTWNLFRHELIFEYEIPKWDGDLGHPNLYMPLTSLGIERKIDLLMKHFGSQRSKDWFDPETFRGLARLRGMECRAEERYAEAFFLKKAQLSLP